MDQETPSPVEFNADIADRLLDLIAPRIDQLGLAKDDARWGC
jgi:hypothetical protein